MMELFFFLLFFFLDESVNEVKEYFNIGNRIHPQLEFTFKISNNSINRLNRNVYKGKMFLQCNKKDTKSYTGIRPKNIFYQFQVIEQNR